MAQMRSNQDCNGQNICDPRELEHMVMNFRVYELQHLLGFANQSRSGKKPELLQRALELVRTTRTLTVQQKVRELARRAPDRQYGTVTSTDNTAAAAINGYRPPTSAYPSATNYAHVSSVGGIPNYAAYHASAAAPAITSTTPAPAPPSMSSSAIWHSACRQNLALYPPVKLIPLPFYDTLSEIVKPTTLVPLTADKFQENYITFVLPQNQICELALNDTVPLPRVELQLRFCLLNTSTEQKDDFPSTCNVRMNDKLVQLPNPIPTNKIGVEPKRPSRPVNITPYFRPTSNVQRIQVTWNHDGSRFWTASIYLVRHLTANILLDRLKTRGERPPAKSIAMIKEKLAGDNDEDIATTSLRVSLLCPLGKMRMRLPCRLHQCTHLQCFDGDLFLRMNEKRPTWTCPVCDKPTPFDDIQLDGYFLEVVEKTTADEGEVELYEDGSWAPVIEKDDDSTVVSSEKRKAPDRNDAAASAMPGQSALSTSINVRAASAETTTSSAGKQASVDNEVSVIDLTEDDSDDDRGCAGADSESSSSGLFFPTNPTNWNRLRPTNTLAPRCDSISSSTSPSMVVLDSPLSTASRFATTPEELRENGTSTGLMLPTWPSDVSTAGSSTTMRTFPTPIGQPSTSAQSGLSASPPKKRYAATTLSPNKSKILPTVVHSASTNDLTSAMMASTFLNSAATGSSINNQSSSTIQSGFGCGIPLLSAMTGMDFHDPNDPLAAATAFGRILATANSGFRLQQQQQQQELMNNAYAGMSNSNSAASSIYGIPSGLHFATTSPTSSYFMNSTSSYSTNPNSYAMRHQDLLTAASAATTAAFAAASAAAASGSSPNEIWDNRWSQDFQEFLNNCLPDSSSRST